MDIWRCDITGNPVGTDTRRVGCPCKCQGCKAGAEIERLRALIEDACKVFDHYDLPEHAFHYRRKLVRAHEQTAPTSAKIALVDDDDQMPLDGHWTT